LDQAQGAGQHHPCAAPTPVAGAQSGGERLAIPARELDLEPGLQLLHGYPGSLLCGLEQAHRPTLAHHVARAPGLGPWVLIIGSWYKTPRRSGQKTSGKAPIHMVSAFAARQRLVLGQVKVAEKSNEIVAIPKLLDLLAVEGAVVTIEAIGCQRDIPQTILDQKAGYVLALKGNQGTLREDVELFVAEQTSNGFKHAASSQAETIDGDHGRIETRHTTVLHHVSWLQERHNWPGLKGVVIVDSIREIGRTIERETR